MLAALAAAVVLAVPYWLLVPARLRRHTVAAGLLVETARHPARRGSFADVLGWIVFLPTFPSGPMEDFEHFRSQRPVFDQARVFGGLERILVGLLKAIVGAEQLGKWASPIV